MPLKGEAKTKYQRDYMRDYMRSKRNSVKTSKPLLRPITATLGEMRKRPDLVLSDLLVKTPPVKTPQKGDGAPLTSKQEKIAELRQIIEPLQSTRSPSKEESNSRIPLYNQETSQVGDRVQMPDGQVLTVPERDSEGSPIPEKGSTGLLASANLFKPTFIPDAKIVRAKKKRW